MFNQIPRRTYPHTQANSSLINYLPYCPTNSYKERSHVLVQLSIESLRQQAIAIIGLSENTIQEKENFNKTEKLLMGRTNKSTSTKKLTNNKNLTINVQDSPNLRTNKKALTRDYDHLERTTEASQKQRVSQKKDKSPKYVRLETSSSKSILQKYGYESQKIKSALNKLKDVQSEKFFLQEKIQELRHLIVQQKNRIDETKLASRNIDNQYNSLSKSASSTSHNMITQKKVYQNVEQEQKSLIFNFESSLKQNQQVLNVITEQEQLITMYKVVIEQLKKEVKNQSRQKSVIQQELITSKNVLEKAKQKYEMLYKKTENLINKLDKGLTGILG